MPNQLVLFTDSDLDPLPLVIARQFDFPLQDHIIEGVYWYAVQDWLRGVAQGQGDPDQFLRDARRRYQETVAQCHSLKYLATDGKTYKRQFATDDILYELTARFQVASDLHTAVIKLMGKSTAYADKLRIAQAKETKKLTPAAKRANRYLKDGRDTSWIGERIEAVEFRNYATKALHDFVHNPDYAGATNTIYYGVYGYMTADLRKVFKIPKNANVRDYLSEIALMYLKTAEKLIAWRLSALPDKITWPEAQAIIGELATEIGKQAQQACDMVGVDLLTGHALLHG